jgi:hypothetical protein
MTAPLFGVNAAAELLERDRRSVQKSLRHVQPDKMERGQPRWKLLTILRALEGLPNAVSNKRRAPRLASDGYLNTLTDEEFAEYQFHQTEAFIRANDAVVEITNAPEAERKSMAPHAFKKIETLAGFFEKAEPDGLSEHALSVIQQMTGGLMHACGIALDPSEFPDET